MKQGFTLIELVVVILIIGLITAIGLPRFFRSGRSKVEDFIGRLNVMVSEGSQLAQQTSVPQRIFFNITAGKVEIQSIAGKTVGGAISIPRDVVIQEVLINGRSAFGSAGEKQTFYFLINADGISQEVTLTVLDSIINKRTPRAGIFTFYLNPFQGIFRLV